MIDTINVALSDRVCGDRITSIFKKTVSSTRTKSQVFRHTLLTQSKKNLNQVRRWYSCNGGAIVLLAFARLVEI